MLESPVGVGVGVAGIWGGLRRNESVWTPSRAINGHPESVVLVDGPKLDALKLGQEVLRFRLPKRNLLRSSPCQRFLSGLSCSELFDTLGAHCYLVRG